MKKLFIFATFFFVINSILCEEYQWEHFGELSVPRAVHQALPINDTLVLVIGGRCFHQNITYKSCEFIDIKNKQVFAAPDMNHARAEFVALLTKDSNVVVIGGYNENVIGNSSIELYDRNTKTWQIIGYMLQQRMQHDAKFINDEEIIIVGGRLTGSTDGTNTAEIFNITTRNSRAITNYPMLANNINIAITSNNKIWGFGAREGGAGSYRTNEIFEYNLITNKWTTVDYMAVINQKPESIKLSNGNILITGGCIKETPVLNSVQVLYENNGLISIKPNLLVPRSWHQMIEYDNEVFVIGGLKNQAIPANETDIINLEDFSNIKGPDLNVQRACHIVTIQTFVKDNSENTYILAIGGTYPAFSQALKSIEYIKMKPKPIICKEIFNYPNFANINNLSLVNNAFPFYNRLRLSSSRSNAYGAMWYNKELPLIMGFITNFSFRLTEPVKSVYSDQSYIGADGIALVIQNNSNRIIGSVGGGIGYEGIPNAIAIEIDLFSNDSFQIENKYDPNGNHIAVMSNGVNPISADHKVENTLAINPNILEIKSDGTVYYVRVEYFQKTKRLRCYISDNKNISSPVLVLNEFELSDYIELDSLGKAFIGLTSATGSDYQNHDILNWDLCIIDEEGILVIEEENDNIIEEALQIWPNPFDSELNIGYISDTNSKANIIIYNVFGNTIDKFETYIDYGYNVIRWQKQNIPSGLYFIKIYNNDKILTGKAVYLK